MKKELLDSALYTFDASARTITFDQSLDLTLRDLLLITNVTDNVIIYNFACEDHGGTFDKRVLTLEYSTVAMDDADELQIVIAVKENSADQHMVELLESIKSSTEVLQDIAELLRMQNELIKELL